MNHPKAKDIDISTDEGLAQLKAKAKDYGHYAEQLKVFELIEELEFLRETILDEASLQVAKNWVGNV